MDLKEVGCVMLHIIMFIVNSVKPLDSVAGCQV
jgi:hypothetical protein